MAHPRCRAEPWTGRARPLIDNRAPTPLSSTHFGVRKRGPRVTVLTLFLLAAALLAGCTPRHPARASEDSLTEGRIRIVCPADVAGLIQREREAFEALYPKARIEVVRGTSSEGIRQLFGARADLAVCTRDLSPEERAAATRGRLGVEGYGMARDAIVVVVHAASPVENLTVEDVRHIYDGHATRWSEYGGPAEEIVPVVQTAGGDLTEAFVQQVMAGNPITARSVYAASDSEVVAEVSRRPGSIGYVTLGWANRGVRALRISSLMGLPYWKPDLEAVYQSEYPLTRAVTLLVRTPGHPLADGFVTFACSRDGQQIVKETGLVPTTVPVRFVRRSPMQGDH
ncbi:MAG: PstS family phosphate ABC transporter substrate-binding protein [Candidatus Eisenbacteria bacterium]